MIHSLCAFVKLRGRIVSRMETVRFLLRIDGVPTIDQGNLRSLEG